MHRLLTVLLLFSTGLQAHRDEESLTTMKWNPRTEMVEVVHLIHLHDAQYILNRLPGLVGESRDVASLQGKAHIALQVEQSLRLRFDDQIVDVHMVGAELEGDFIIVMQEFFPEEADTLTVRFELFQSIIESYTSRVIILLPGMRKTLLLDRDNPIQSVALTATTPSWGPSAHQPENP